MDAKTSGDGLPELSKLLLSATGGILSSSMAVMLSPAAAPLNDSGEELQQRSACPLIAGTRRHLTTCSGPAEKHFVSVAACTQTPTSSRSRRPHRRTWKRPAPYRVQQDIHWRVNKVRLACPRTVDWPRLVRRRTSAGAQLGRSGRRGGRQEQLNATVYGRACDTEGATWAFKVEYRSSPTLANVGPVRARRAPG